MRKFISFIFVALFSLPISAQDDQNVQDEQKNQVEEVSAEALERLIPDENEPTASAPATPEEQKPEDSTEESTTPIESEENTKQETEKDEASSQEQSYSNNVSNDDDKTSNLSNDDNSSYKAHKKSSVSDEDMHTFFKWVFILFLVWVFYKIIKYRYSRKCDSCGKWNSMKVIGKELVDQKNSSITEKRKVRDGQGNILKSYDVDLPATIYTYHIHRRCKHCGYEDIVVKQVKQKN